MPEMILSYWYVIVVVAGLWALLVKLGVFLPPHASLIIKIREGKPRVTRGRLQAQAMEFISDILQQAGVKKGFVTVGPGRWVAFSRDIPKEHRQRIRNILLNL